MEGRELDEAGGDGVANLAEDERVKSLGTLQ
jgi:hypothetical protein